MRSIGSINENEWKGKPAQRLGTSRFSRLCLRRRAGGSAERTLSAGILFRKHILMQNVLPAVSDRPIQLENLKPALITRSKVREISPVGTRTGVQGFNPCLPLPRVRKWVKLANRNANRGAGGHPLPSPATRSKAREISPVGTRTGVQGFNPCRAGVQGHCPWGVTWRPSRRRSEPALR